MIASFLLLLVASSVPNACAIFAPRSRAPIALVKKPHHSSASHQMGIASLPTSSYGSNTAALALAVSGGAKDDSEDLGLLQSLVDTDFLVIDTAVVATEVADNWGLILASGLLSTATGCLALYNPFEATDVAFLSTVATLSISGVINMGGSLFAERGYKILTLIMGISQVALSGLMAADPFDSEFALSLGVTMSVFVDGLYRVVLVLQNPELPGWWPTFFEGMAAMAASVYVTRYMPLTFVAAPGIAMGVRLVTSGIARVAVALGGRSLAKESSS